MPFPTQWPAIALMAPLISCGPAMVRPLAMAASNTTGEVRLSQAAIQVSEALLRRSWKQYKSRFIQGDGRVIDRKARGVSTSEGQAYAALRSVWMDDRRTFDRVLAWADNNLNAGARADHLFGWRWGQREDGIWGVMDRTAASDADQLAAYALIQAHKKWGEEKYLDRAKDILADIWDKETVKIGRKRYILPGDWKRTPDAIRINPSYYLPFAYRTFHEVDPDRGWKKLVDSSYRVLEECRSRVGLPTDWCFIDPDNAKITLETAPSNRSSDFGYEAIRVYWNLTADLQWHNEARAARLLQEMDWILRYWVVRRSIPAVVTYDGIPRELHDSPALYGALLPALAQLNPAQATTLYQEKVAPSYHDGFWGDPDDYYAQNWLWFGLALMSELSKA